MPKNSETEESTNKPMKTFNQRYDEVQKLPKNKKHAERLKAATQEAETQHNAQSQRVVNKTTPDKKAEASQSLVTEASNDSAVKAPMQVSQDDNSDEDTAEPIISYPGEENWEKLDGPAQNTRSQHQTRITTQEYMLATLEISKVAKTGCNAKVSIESSWEKQ